ncbi:class I SAM-dependent methyltransferase [Bosea sp. (in: a-proteobacteria)]|uniref:class I SAM-dependent methyltransferase n=1 Tax=Bosea sp. (in: a-proteobacteria) TaxID=1871050 RepID=UPI003F6E4C50
MTVDRRDTDKDWNVISEADPYWGVLSAEKFKGSELSPAVAAEFFESGSAYVERLLGFVNAYLPSGALKYDSALDFGCGVGRLLIPLARRFVRADGVDISPRMLNIARQHAADAALSNINFYLSTDQLSDIEGGYDLVNTLIVLQHIPPHRGLQIIERLISLTRPGGVCSMQLTFARSRKFLEHEAPAARYYRRTGDGMLDLRARTKGYPEGTVTMYDYDLNEIHALLHELSGSSHFLCLPTEDDGHLGIHFVFVRR